MARLRITSGPLEGKTIDLDGDLIVGRQDTDLEIEDLELSRKHAVFRRASGRVQVEDLGSKNGTFVDGKRISEPTLVGGGAEIRVGVTTLVVEGVLPVSAPAEPQPAAEPAAAAAAPSAAAPSAAAPSAAAPSDVPIADTTKTRVHHVPAGMQQAPAPPAAAPAPPLAAPAGGTPAPAMPVGEFRPPRERHDRGLASRSWVPVFASFGTAILTAAGLVVYFGTR